MKHNISSELRLGNLVLVSGRIEEISYIGETECGSINRPCHMSLRHFNYDDIMPIKITKNWLIDLGFEKGMIPDMFTDANSNYHIVKHGEKFIFRGLGASVVTIESVHELQNVYFFLMKTELKYEA